MSSTRFQVDAKRSRIIVETWTSGLSTMFAHDHKIEVREFSGAVFFSRQPVATGGFELNIVASSLRLVDEGDAGERQAVEAAVREDVLETAKYPAISFKSKAVKLERREDGTYDVRLTGELRLHGVRRQVTVPARMALMSGTLRAIGLLEIRQSDFDITPFSFAGGPVVIEDRLTISFDLLATPV